MPVKEIGEDLFEVREFVQSMPNLVYQVAFTKGVARVVYREGCTSTEWDQHAIQTVQSFQITGMS